MITLVVSGVVVVAAVVVSWLVIRSMNQTIEPEVYVVKGERLLPAEAERAEHSSCKWCKGSMNFLPYRRNRRYCSVGCRRQAERAARGRPVASTKVPCLNPECDKNLPNRKRRGRSRRSDRKYCSKKCTARFHYLKRKGLLTQASI